MVCYSNSPRQLGLLISAVWLLINLEETIKEIFKFVQEITVPNKYFEQINVYVTNAINNMYIDQVLKQDKGMPFIHGWSFILSILFNIREIADIMGDLTDGMRDFTGVINWRIHLWL